MLLFCVKAVPIDSCNFELSHLKVKKKENILPSDSFLVWYFHSVLCVTRSVVGHGQASYTYSLQAQSSRLYWPTQIEILQVINNWRWLQPGKEPNGYIFFTGATSELVDVCRDSMDIC